LPILWKFFFKGILCHKLLVKKITKIATTAYNMKGCLSFFYFHILNIAKFGEIFLWMILPLEQHCKIEKIKPCFVYIYSFLHLLYWLQYQFT
jgi:hypothetical protein